jgi:hypothetical protein
MEQLAYPIFNSRKGDAVLIDNRDESMVLEFLDDTLQRLDIFKNQVIDAEAIAHSVAQMLTEMTESNPDRALARAKSLALSSAKNTKKLLDEVTTWLTELQGQRGDDTDGA